MKINPEQMFRTVLRILKFCKQKKEMANSNEIFGPSLFDNDNAYQVDLAKAKASGQKPKRVTRKKERIGHVGEIDAIVKKQEEDGRRQGQCGR